jgi:carbon storage regulator
MGITGGVLPVTFPATEGIQVMLVLTRKEGEAVVIGENIVVRLELISGNRARISFEAPPEIPIRRAELELQPVKQRRPAEPAR